MSIANTLPRASEAHRARRRPGAVALAVLTVAITLAVPGTRAAAADGPTRYRDFWIDTYGDGMDFDNAADVVVADDGPMQGLTGPRLGNGVLSFAVDKPGYFSPLWGGYADAIPHGREGSLRPVDASRYDTIVLRMRSDHELDAGVRWYSCPAGVADHCQGGFNFRMKEGWETYRFAMENQSDDPALRNARWTGAISGLRLAFGASSGTHVEVDWIRLVAPDAAGSIAGDWSVIGTPARPAALGPVDPRPRKGFDYTDVARRGDRWDFASPSDVRSSGNVNALGVSGGQLRGTSKASSDNRPGDPFVLLPLGKPALRITTYHRLAIRMSLSGAYSQQFAVGGGSTLRLRLRFAGRPGYVLTRPIAIYPNEEWIVIDLLDRNIADGKPVDPIDVFDPAYTRGAAHTTSATILKASNLRSSGMSLFAMPASSGIDPTATVTDFGVDPTEDYGARDFTIDEVTLGADQPAPPPTFAPLDRNRPSAELEAACWNEIRALNSPPSNRASLASNLDVWCKASLPGWPLIQADATICASLQDEQNLGVRQSAATLESYRRSCGVVQAALNRLARMPAPWWLGGKETDTSPTEQDCAQMLADLAYFPARLSMGIRPECTDRHRDTRLFGGPKSYVYYAMQVEMLAQRGYFKQLDLVEQTRLQANATVCLKMLEFWESTHPEWPILR